MSLDGKGVACDAQGVTDFELLRAALGRPAKCEVFLFAFDLLELDERDLRRAPTGAGSSRAFYAVPVTASSCRIISKVMTATRSSATLARWGSKALSLSEEIGRIGRDDRQTGSK